VVATVVAVRAETLVRAESVRSLGRIGREVGLEGNGLGYGLALAFKNA